MIVNYPDSKIYSYQEIGYGDCFRIIHMDSIIYIKIKSTDADKFNAASIIDGTLIYIQDNINVIKVEGTFVVK